MSAARIIHIQASGGILFEKKESRDCWMCVHIENDNGRVPQPVCAACKWYGSNPPGPEDNYRERPDGRWKG